MKVFAKNKSTKGQKGFSLPELIIALLVLAILVVIALPQMISARRAFSFSGMKRQAAVTLTDARLEAVSQRKAITVHYNNTDKRMVIHGGKFGALGDAQNQIVELSGSGLNADDIVYGHPIGATTALADTSNLTPLVANTVSITFHSDGSVVDSANNPQNNALFFYNRIYPNDMAFAISVLGAGGRVKIWRYNQNTNSYVE